MNSYEEIDCYLRACFPILYIETFEEQRAYPILVEWAKSLNYEIIEHNSRGLFFPAENKKTINDLASALKNFIEQPTNSGIDFNLNKKILIIKDNEKTLDTTAVCGALKFIAEAIMSDEDELDARIVILSPVVSIPKELEHLITLISFEHPSDIEIANIIKNFCDEQKIDITESLNNELKTALKGMPAFDIRNTLALAYIPSGKLTKESLNIIYEQKKQIIKKSGIMDMIDTHDSFYEDIGGLENIKHYLERKRTIFQNLEKAKAFGIEPPKGLLIAGLPGCGKSLTAKATASLFRIPLLRLDMGRLMGKYVGESEANLRRALQIAEAIAPCVLWVDELEKAFSGVGGHGANAELTTRLMGNFLTWMQEKNSLVFVIATVNDISGIPPELLRKGRFDELFYVDLPNEDERKTILSIHIRKRRPQDLDHLDIDALARDMEGFSGADIEGVVKDALEECFYQKLDRLEERALSDAMTLAHPLKETMSEEIDAMLEEYKKRQFKNASEGC